MRISEQTWDVAIYKQPSDVDRIGLPSVLTRALRAKGYNRARLEITEQGILLIPYAGEATVANATGDITLPDWNGS